MKKFLRSLFWLAAIVGALVLLSPVVTNRFTQQQATPDSTQQSSSRHSRRANGSGTGIPVLSAPVLTRDVPVYIDGVGSGRAWNSVLVRSQVDGVMLKLFFNEGQMVKAGDMLAKIDPSLYQAQYDQVVAKKGQDEATLANAKLDLQRYQGLATTNAVTKQQLDTQRATVAQNEALVQYDTAAIASARTTLNYTDIRSPIDGRTGLRNVDAGNLVHASDTSGIVTVAQIQPIAIIFTVPQQQLERINTAIAHGAGDLLVEALDNSGTSVIDTGVLSVVNNTIDQTTGTVQLKARFPNKDLQIWPGAFINVRLRVETLKQALVVPASALQRGPTGSFVYLLQDDKAVVRPITVGQQDDQQAVVTAGLAAGDHVVTSGFARLTNGAQVNAAEDPSISASDPALHQITAMPPRGHQGRSSIPRVSGESTSPSASSAIAGSAPEETAASTAPTAIQGKPKSATQ
ncbi:efflux RND transporter periplasmic adaptor subunit [Beijerinckia indica]|uniref:Efflux transporter, RND family, MFP subunit n=1 Tax=Beijerinckia indica subsp. indica (strain ATCC 9039 / DSM 1715 / NCIMB 8712) TaxID=395963 RepID=B2IKV0_BEII9|nr:efflux RND transporter periplasmic adaptor subunit [Beijerinckia indica]ACB96490.1 efflux transporter, RND family, MFP subunit [Beijerinckia indica subsp. indica ATCC 9039]